MDSEAYTSAGVIFFPRTHNMVPLFKKASTLPGFNCSSSASSTTSISTFVPWSARIWAKPSGVASCDVSSLPSELFDKTTTRSASPPEGPSDMLAPPACTSVHDMDITATKTAANIPLDFDIRNILKHLLFSAQPKGLFFEHITQLL